MLRLLIFVMLMTVCENGGSGPDCIYIPWKRLRGTDPPVVGPIVFK